MTKRDFEAVAKVIREEYATDWPRPLAPDVASRLTLDAVSLHLCEVFAESNPRFDRQRFLTACREDDKR